MPVALIRRVVVCLIIAAPAITLRIADVELAPVIELLAYGAAVVAAAFLLAWAAEAAQKDISGALAIALLALIAVLPEYAVDFYFAFRSGSEAQYAHFAAANMTGSNRLLLGIGWPLVVIICALRARRAAPPEGSRTVEALRLDPGSRLDIGFLVLLCIIAFAIPVLGGIPLWLGIGLVAFFVAYLWRAGRSEVGDDAEFLGAAALIADLPRTARRFTVVVLFAVSAGIILACAEPFSEALVASGSALGIDSYFLVQWLAPAASEAPEFIIAAMFALRGMGSAAIGTLIAAKVNQWSLLVGSLPIAHLLGGGGTGLPLDGRQIEEFALTATQSLLGVALILSLRFHWAAALGLAGLFGLQFIVTDTSGRYVLCAIQAGLALVFLIVHRRDILPTLRAPFARATPSPAVGAVQAAGVRGSAVGRDPTDGGDPATRVRA